VFDHDDNLLLAYGKAEAEIDKDPSQADDVANVPEIMDVVVLSPWTLGSKLRSRVFLQLATVRSSRRLGSVRGG
jgi:hypothetical protein